MTAPLDFAALPPEVNSGRMYAGAGAGPMLAASSAWNGLATELCTTALGYYSVLSELTSQAWYGPASVSMAAAAAPYAAWLSTTAARAEDAAAQAGDAVAAYEAAFAATVPPLVVAANRAHLAWLTATNFFGQNTPAIATTEAQYGEMWAQDAAAMYAYAASSAIATRLTPFDPPPQTINQSRVASQSAAVAQATAARLGTEQTALSQLLYASPSALHDLAASESATTTSETLTLTTGASQSTTGSSESVASWLWENFGANANIWNTIFGSGFYMPARFLGNATDFISVSQAGGQAAGAAEGAGAAAGAAASPLGGAGALGNSVAGSMGEGSSLGPLSVPPSWSATTPVQSPLSSALGGEPMAAPPSAPAPVTGSTPPVPMGPNMGGRGEGRAIPQYGFRPSFVARPPAAG